MERPAQFCYDRLYELVAYFGNRHRSTVYGLHAIAPARICVHEQSQNESSEEAGSEADIFGFQRRNNHDHLRSDHPLLDAGFGMGVLVSVLAFVMNDVSQSREEHVLYAATTHWVKYVPRAARFHLFLIFALILLYVSLAVASFSPQLSFAVFFPAACLALIAHHLFFHLIMSEEMIDIIVTDQRIIYFEDCLFLSDNEHEIPLEKIAAVEVIQKGIVQNMLNYGMLWIDTGGGAVDLKRSLAHVSSPEEVAEHIAEAKQKFA